MRRARNNNSGNDPMPGLQSSKNPKDLAMELELMMSSNAPSTSLRRDAERRAASNISSSASAPGGPSRKSSSSSSNKKMPDSERWNLVRALQETGLDAAKAAEKAQLFDDSKTVGSQKSTRSWWGGRRGRKKSSSKTGIDGVAFGALGKLKKSLKKPKGDLAEDFFDGASFDERSIGSYDNLSVNSEPDFVGGKGNRLKARVESDAQSVSSVRSSGSLGRMKRRPRRPQKPELDPGFQKTLQAFDKVAMERAAAERAAAERLARERERLAREKAAQELLAQERAAAEQRMRQMMEQQMFEQQMRQRQMMTTAYGKPMMEQAVFDPSLVARTRATKADNESLTDHSETMGDPPFLVSSPPPSAPSEFSETSSALSFTELTLERPPTFIERVLKGRKTKNKEEIKGYAAPAPKASRLLTDELDELISYSGQMEDDAASFSQFGMVPNPGMMMNQQFQELSGNYHNQQSMMLMMQQQQQQKLMMIQQQHNIMLMMQQQQRLNGINIPNGINNMNSGMNGISMFNGMNGIAGSGLDAMNSGTSSTQVRSTSYDADLPNQLTGLNNFSSLGSAPSDLNAFLSSQSGGRKVGHSTDSLSAQSASTNPSLDLNDLKNAPGNDYIPEQTSSLAYRDMSDLIVGETKECLEDDDDEVDDDASAVALLSSMMSTWAANRPTPGKDGLPKSCLKGSSSDPERSSMNVRFHAVQIREYERVVGDNPSCSSGPPISIGWSVMNSVEQSLDDYETKKPIKRNKRQFYLPASKRSNLLMNVWEYPEEDLRKARREATYIQYCREKSSFSGIRGATKEAAGFLKRGSQSSKSSSGPPPPSAPLISSQPPVAARQSTFGEARDIPVSRATVGHRSSLEI